MDRSSYEALGRLTNTAAGTPGAEDANRSSVDARRPQTARLQKKKSDAGVRATGQGQIASASTPGRGDFRDSAGPTDGAKARKGSIRHAVRRIFGRMSKHSEPEPGPESGSSTAETTNLRYYHRSEPSWLPTPSETLERSEEIETFSERTRSAPAPPKAPAEIPRTRAPYAVEFPQSARLKPVALGHPFYAPGSTLRRRKSLPSVLVSESDGAVVSDALSSTHAEAARGDQLEQADPSQEIGVALSTNRKDKRRSRSANDIRKEMLAAAAPARKRSDEIQFWRESYQPDVLRTSGFRVPPPRTGQVGSEVRRSPVVAAQNIDPFVETRRPQTDTPASRRDFAEGDWPSLSPLGTELSRDLEDRVSSLETNLRRFQDDLRRLTVHQSREVSGFTGTPDLPASTERRDERSPGMLVERLAFPMGPSNYQYDFSPTHRYSRSSQVPQTPVRTSDRRTAAPIAPRREEARSSSPPQPVVAYPPPTAADEPPPPSPPPQYTFRSLYEMLADERSARRKLEKQLHSLRQEIRNMQYQVSVPSNVQSQRSSYGYTDPTVGSSRLQALLRETEDEPVETTASYDRLSGEQPTGVMTSRFSASESENAYAESETF